jgi:hypothetical protein
MPYSNLETGPYRSCLLFNLMFLLAQFSAQMSALILPIWISLLSMKSADTHLLWSSILCDWNWCQARLAKTKFKDFTDHVINNC